MKNKLFLGTGLMFSSAFLMLATNVNASIEQEGFEKNIVKDKGAYSQYRVSNYGEYYNHDYFGLKKVSTYYPNSIISNMEKTTGLRLDTQQVTKIQLNYKQLITLKKDIIEIDNELKKNNTLKENYLQDIINIIYKELPLGKKINEDYTVNSSDITVYIETTISPNNSFERRILFFQKGKMIYKDFLPMKKYQNQEKVINEGVYSDLPDSHWSYLYVKALSQLGIVNGSNGQYNPNNSITRAQFSAMLSRTLPRATAITNEPIFKDVTDSNWAKDDIHLLYEMGIITGYSDGTFKPNQPITRQQAVAMIGRYFDALNITVQEPQSGASNVIFADNNKIATYAAEQVNMLYQLDVISGSKNEKGEVVFKPTGNLTRAQMAKILYNSLELKSKVIE